LFTISEEIGCVGIEHFVKTNAEWFKDVAYDITIDRRYGDNLLWQQCGKYSCSKEFASELASIGIQQGIPVKLENGTVADVIYIREFVKESVNISAGYYEPHSEEEYIIYDDVIRITKWLATFIKKYQPKKTVKLLTELTK
jgi:acetylornithine deacetylase/succinyl-diaminopimelate desuccinylase-like protein